MNLSRAYSLNQTDIFSVGRVQTPTLALVVEQDLEIEAFKPEEYQIVELKLSRGELIKVKLCELSEGFTSKIQRFFFKRQKEAEQIKNELESVQKYTVEKIKDKRLTIEPPQLFDLTELQRQANRLFTWPASKTLNVAQSLYENKKLITYPRTDSRYLSTDLEASFKKVAQSLTDRFNLVKNDCDFSRSLSKRFVDNKSVSDHHAIIPIYKSKTVKLNSDEEKLYDLIARSCVMAYMKPAHLAITELWFSPEKATSQPFFFYVKGRQTLDLGWRKISKSSFGEDVSLASDISKGDIWESKSIHLPVLKTSAPPRFSDASLLTAMETAGKKLDDKEISDAMKEKGLGTPATRSSIIEALIQRSYLIREKKMIVSTDKGRQLIERVDDSVKSASLTGEWEFRLEQLRQQKIEFDDFMESITSYVKKLTQTALKASTNTNSFQSGESVSQSFEVKSAMSLGKLASADEGSTVPIANRPVTTNLNVLLKERFGFDSFRPYQEAICKDVVDGLDSLLVMPTGAGKSLCYQLPGLARGGATLVISPLIALMDDQVQKLTELNLKAEAIHSGKSREVSREICRRYARGDIEFLFIAPERLGVPGFIEFLAKYRPSLIAIDEAHCISQWGHDFRYDYRLLKERLKPLRPTPITAMTATATTTVQEDITSQLGLEKPALHIRGFRRTNLAIEAISVSKAKRSEAIAEIFKDYRNLPAIVYAPTRKQAEQVAQELSRNFKVAAYHAGMHTDERSSVQDSFLKDELDAIVATTAFGMGVDKSNIRSVIHLALPGSIEAYYQEIGRAGRDGKLSNAILLYSYADLRTHEYFHKKNYPDTNVLELVLEWVKTAQMPKLLESLDEQDLTNHLDRLVMIGLIHKDLNGAYHYLNNKNWKTSYEKQKSYKFEQLQQVERFASQKDKCRMLSLMAHFGDADASGKSCGLCDVCSPETSLIAINKSVSERERMMAKLVINKLKEENRAVAMGTLFRDLAEARSWKRAAFDELVQAMVSSGYCSIKQSSFEKAGRKINYKLLELISTPKEEELKQLKLTKFESSEIPKRKYEEVSLSVDELSLFESLRKWRSKHASKSRVPPYRVLSDRSLQELSSLKPKSEKDLLKIYGFGAKKIEKYGKELIDFFNASLD